MTLRQLCSVTAIRGGGGDNTKHIHPTQKPVELYARILGRFANPGDSVFDPMFGSASSRISAYKLGFDYVGCEINKDFYNKAEERFKRECLGISKLPNGKTETQTKLFES